MAEDWDLFAVVNSCSSAANSTVNVQTPAIDFTNDDNGYWPCSSNSVKFEEEDNPFSFPNLSQLRKSGCLQDSYKPFLPYGDPTTSTNQGIDPISSSSSVFGGSNGQHHQHQQPTISGIGINPPPLTPTTAPIFSLLQSINPQHVQQQTQPQQQNPIKRQQELQTPTVARNVQSQGPRSRKRKNQQKRTVCHVTADNLTSDPWAWRKYGQKPIKGSPYPRNYYRCSSSKGCTARKQVERSNLDPNISIITYTGEHTHPKPTHRNSLAGSTRNKLLTVQKTSTSKDSTLETSPRLPPISPTTPISAPEAQVHNVSGGEEESIQLAVDGESDENDDLLIPNVHMDEDFFKGLDEFVGDGNTATNRLGHNPAFGDNSSSWDTDSSATAGAGSGGGI